MIELTILVFAALFALSLVIVLTAIKAKQSPAAKLKSRLHRMAIGDDDDTAAVIERVGKESTTPLQRFLYGLPLMGKIREAIDRSGLHVSPVLFLALTAAAAAFTFLLVFALKKNAYFAVAAACAVVVGAFGFLSYCRAKRETKFTEQLPDALVMISRSLRAGHSLTGAVELVGVELPDPAGALFKFAYEQQRLGMRMSDSLATLPRKIKSLDLHFFVTIIKINSETGGNLAEILDKLAETIRSRLQIRRQVRVYTAEGRVSGYVLVILPVFVFGLFYMMHPNYMDPFFNERVCQLSLIAAGLAQVVGFMFIRKIVNIRI